MGDSAMVFESTVADIALKKFDGRRVCVLIYVTLLQLEVFYGVKDELFYLVGFAIWTCRRFGTNAA